MIPAAGGWGRALAAMIETGIIVPSGLGVTKNVEEEVKKAAEEGKRKKTSPRKRIENVKKRGGSTPPEAILPALEKKKPRREVPFLCSRGRWRAMAE